ncbi:YceI family protein [Luteimonas abyssi]|uniref:YceI family protein n=1 Tax=Luteimonas abyssi TaxID=1247514 RepID=UPI000737CCA0|nr:YceI family protein [Luteimonas abyssi]
MPKFLLAFVLIALTLPVAAADYVQTRGSSLVFAGTYQGQPFTGHFPGFRTTLSFDPAQPEAGRLEVSIPLATATTNNPDYDPEMRGPSFLDVARFATARYTAHGFRALDDGRFAADGTLDLHGVQQPVTLTFTWTPGEQPVLSGRATVPRLAFGIGSGEWASTSIIPDDISVSTRVVLAPAP